MSMIKYTHPDVYWENIGILQQAQQYFTSKRATSVPYQFTVQINAGLNEMIDRIGFVLPEPIGKNNCATLDSLIATGKLKLIRFKHSMGDINDFTMELFENLQKAIPTSFPLYDEHSNNLMKEALDSKIITLSDIEKTKITHAGLTDNYFQRLPSFETASVSEIIDIRKDLEKPLVRFRGQMLKYTDAVEAMP